VVDAATAAATYDRDHLPDAPVLVCRQDGPVTEATVLRRVDDTFDLLATSGPQPTTAVLAAGTVLAAAADTLAAADLVPAQVGAVICLAPPADLPAIASALHHRLGIPVIPTPAAGTALACGALDTRPTIGPDRPAPPAGMLARQVGHVIVAAAGSAALFIQALAGTTVYPAAETASGTTLIVAEWANYAVAAVGAVLTAVAVAHLVASLGHPASRASQRLGFGLTVAASVGIATAIGYALAAAVTTQTSVGAYLAWTLLPAAAVAVPVALTGLLLQYGSAQAVHTRPPPVFPSTALLLAAAGVFGIAAADTNVPATSDTIWPLLQRGGGAAVGAALAILLTRRRPALLLTGPLLTAALAALADIHTAQTMGIIVTVAAALWWFVQAARLSPLHAAVLAALHPPSVPESARPAPPTNVDKPPHLSADLAGPAAGLTPPLSGQDHVHPDAPPVEAAPAQPAVTPPDEPDGSCIVQPATQ
jgi:hypothetical protein